MGLGSYDVCEGMILRLFLNGTVASQDDPASALELDDEHLRH